MNCRGTFRRLRRNRLHALLTGAGRLPEVRSFKVRDVVDLDDRLLVVTSDRVSAFDRVLTTIPGKGQVLNQLSVFWFRHTADIVANHLLARGDAAQHAGAALLDGAGGGGGARLPDRLGVA